MSNTLKPSYNNAAQAFMSAALNSLASANYATSAAFQISSNNDRDVQIDVAMSVGTVSGNKQVILYIIGSADGSTYDIQNSGASDTTHDTMMAVLGVVPCPNNSEVVTRRFNVAAAYGGTPPPYFKIIVKNDTGAALAASGSYLKTTEVWDVIA